jgi:ribosomal protein S12 methylthiotransferase accessory factor
VATFHDTTTIDYPPSAPQRSVSTGEAIATALADLARLDVAVSVDMFAGETFSTHRCVLRTGDGRIVARGTGKGLGAQSLASTLFEAIERYFTSADQSRLSLETENVAVCTARDIARQDLLRQDLVIQRLARQQPDVAVGCLRMQSLTDSDVSVWYPLMLVDPGYLLHPLPGDSLEAQPTLRRYITSSGTAAGITSGEALAHALCEWIEHDALSLALLRWYVARDATPAIVDPQSLPPMLATLCAQIKKALGKDVALIDTTSDFGLPSYFAVPTEPPTPALFWGAGTAPDPVYAAERTLSELLQVATVYASDPEHFSRSHERIAGRLAPWPTLRAIGRCDMSAMFASGPPRHVPLRSEAVAAESADGLVQHLLRLFADEGYPCLVATLSDDRVATHVLAVRVPGLERFGGQVIAGYPALPTGRGMAMWPRRTK